MSNGKKIVNICIPPYFYVKLHSDENELNKLYAITLNIFIWQKFCL